MTHQGLGGPAPSPLQAACPLCCPCPAGSITPSRRARVPSGVWGVAGGDPGRHPRLRPHHPAALRAGRGADFHSLPTRFHSLPRRRPPRAAAAPAAKPGLLLADLSLSVSVCPSPVCSVEDVANLTASDVMNRVNLGYLQGNSAPAVASRGVRPQGGSLQAGLVLPASTTGTPPPPAATAGSGSRVLVGPSRTIPAPRASIPVLV